MKKFLNKYHEFIWGAVALLVLAGLIFAYNLREEPYLQVLEDPYSQKEIKGGFGDKMFGATGIRPTNFKTTLAESLSATASTTENITLSSVTTVDDHDLTSDDIGDFMCFHINPGAANDELACCSGGISGTTIQDCTRGYGFYTQAAVSGNEKSHSPGETVIISNDDAYLAEQYPSIDDNETIYGAWEFSTTTSKSKLYFGDTTAARGAYLWYDGSSDGFGYATSGTEFIFSGSGTTFTAISPMTLISGELKLSTSTNEFDLSSGNLSLFLNNSMTSNASGLAVATSSNFTWAGTNTFHATTTKQHGARGSLVPVGTIQMYVATTSPQGWLLCNGSAVSRTNFSSLFAIIGERYGNGDGSTTFNLPDMRQRMPIGLHTGASDGIGDMLGETGGATSTNMTEDQLASHGHEMDFYATDGSGGWKGTNSGGSYDRTQTSQSTGSGEDLPTLDPYITVQYIIKY